MLRISATTTVRSAVPETWRLVSDTASYGAWIDHTLAVLRTDGPAARGTTYEERSRLLGPLGLRTRWEVTDLDAPRHQLHVGRGLPLVRQLWVSFDVEARGPDATAVTFTLAARPRPGLGRAAGLARPLLERRHRRSLRSLAAALGGEAA